MAHRSFRVVLLFLFSLVMTVQAQNAKKSFKAGEKFLELKNYKDAINNFTSAINADPNFDKAYVARAGCYEVLGEKEKAIADYERAIVFMPKEKELYCKAGRLYLELGDYTNADKKYKKVLEMDDKYVDAIDGMIGVLHKTQRYHEALKYCETALDEKKTAVNYFNLALTLDSLKSYVEAEKNYKQAKYYDSKYIIAYVGLSNVQLKLKKEEEALKTCEAALLKSPENIDILTARSSVYAAKNDLQLAVNDISKVLASKPGEREFMLRAGYYQKLGQYQNAVTDYSKAIEFNPKNVDAYYYRATNYEQMTKYSLATKDYEKLLQLIPRDEKAAQLLESVKKKLYEFNRETNKPEIMIASPKVDKKNVMKVAGDLNEIVINGSIEDENFIKSITVNSAKVEFKKDTTSPSFSANVKMDNLKEVTVEAEDIYQNKRTVTYTIEKTEVSKPLVALLAPYASFDNEVYLPNESPELYVEGIIKDESLISSVIVDGVNASFDLTQLNPKFSATIKIAYKEKFRVSVQDIYGNETITEYKVSKGATGDNNPMGITWMIFIENSNYNSFSRLEGPEKDIRMMKSSLTGYKVSNVIHKKNMTKADLEKFFSIELRDLLKSNKVNSVMIWYAGHGKMINDVGYWIPVDAKLDEEISYFNLGSLRSYLQNYAQVVHMLVVTDACESGETFISARRDSPSTCDDWEKTKFKSAQVVTSAGFELASDNSQFATVFSGSLTNNPEPCIAIDKVYKKIESAFEISGKQKPKFGVIKNVPDDAGSFFFIKK